MVGAARGEAEDSTTGIIDGGARNGEVVGEEHQRFAGLGAARRAQRIHQVAQYRARW